MPTLAMPLSPQEYKILVLFYPKKAVCNVLTLINRHVKICQECALHTHAQTASSHNNPGFTPRKWMGKSPKNFSPVESPLLASCQLGIF